MVRRRQPLAVAPGAALCSRCWSDRWYEEASTFASTFAREARPQPVRIAAHQLHRELPEIYGDLIEGWPVDAMWDDPCADETVESLPPPRQLSEFVCVICMQIRPRNQRHDGDRCVDCYDER